MTNDIGFDRTDTRTMIYTITGIIIFLIGLAIGYYLYFEKKDFVDNNCIADKIELTLSSGNIMNIKIPFYYDGLTMGELKSQYYKYGNISRSLLLMGVDRMIKDCYYK